MFFSCRSKFTAAVVAATFVFVFSFPTNGASSAKPKLKKINHIIVLYLENHSFDNLYGEFPGAEGFMHAKYPQVDSSGKVCKILPSPMNTGAAPPVADPRFPANLPNAPFNIDKYIPANEAIPDLVHKFYQEQQQIDGGKMDKFALVSNARGLSLGYYHTKNLPLAAEAKKYTLCDNFFHSAFGGSFLNHIWFVAAATPVFPNAPASLIAKLDAAGAMQKDGAVTPDGFAVNTCFSVNTPHPPDVAATKLLPNQTMSTIGDRLSDAHISWAWYSGGWNDALAGHADSTFQYHHQPFIYFKNFADGTAQKKEHLKDDAEFLAAAKAGTLPAVSFVKPLGKYNEHPGYADMATGEKYVEQLINAVRTGPNWHDAVIIVTYDEHGGFWDHVAPPVIDRWGPGSRVPAIIISPFSKKGFVDHTPLETVSILSLIEHRYGLAPLGPRDAAASDLTSALKL